VPPILGVYQVKKNTFFKRSELGIIEFIEEFLHYDFTSRSFHSNIFLVNNLTYTVLFSMKCDLEPSNFALCRRFLSKIASCGFVRYSF